MKRLSSSLAPSRRLLGPVALLVVATFALSACSSGSAPAAATVNGTDISRRDLQKDLQALVGNPDLLTKLQSSQSFQGMTISEDVVPAALTASWLTTLASQVIIDDAFQQRDLKVTEADKASARSEIEQSQGFGPKASFEKFPTWFQDELIDQQAKTSVLRADLQKTAKVAEATIKRLYDQNAAQFCPSGKLVAHIRVGTEADAQAVEAQLAQGTSFDQLAQSVSTDATSVATGGRLTCIDSQDWSQREDDAFRNAAAGLAVGSVSAPVKTSQGWSIIKVTDFSYENAKPLIEQLIADQVDPLNALLTRQLKKADITVDPRYGRVAKGGQSFSIKPPVARTPKSRPSSSSTTPTTAPAGTGSSSSTGG